MYTIKLAAQITRVPEASLRAWERRYGVVSPDRNDAGYRLYGQEDLAVISTMRRLLDEGWSPAAAADALRSGAIPAVLDRADDTDHPVTEGDPAQPQAASHTQDFLRAAAQLDIAGIDACLDAGFALGSFEHVVDSWLFPALEALGESWARGEIDVAGEHAAAHAVHRRLAAAFDAAGSRSRGAAVVVGLPSGSMHELGALAFATAARRRGMNVLYLGANVPVGSWETAVHSHAARAVVLAVVTPQDRPAAMAVADRLAEHELSPAVFSGGACAESLGAGVRQLAPSITAAAEELDRLMHED